MTEQPYVRYTLRLPSAGEDASAAEGAGGPGGVRERPAVSAGEGALPLEVYDLLARLQPAGWEEADRGRVVRFWLPQGAEAGAPTAPLLRRVGALGALTSEAQEAGWQDGWRRFHRPVVEGRVRVRPPWYPPEPGLLDIVVDSAMAFGTGSHVTTRLCLRALQEVAPASLLDAGAGSGVLALAAARLGFTPVTAVDNDAIAVAACAANAAINGIELEVIEADVTAAGAALPEVEVCVANLLQGPILALADRLREGPWRPRRLILSGLLVDQGDEVVAALGGYELVASEQASGWRALRLERHD